jgi:hypothetical protein
MRPVTSAPPPAWRTAPTCALCGEDWTPWAGWPLEYTARTRDHIIPISWGGPDAEWNFRAAHSICNSQRGNGRREYDVRDLLDNFVRITDGRISLRVLEARAIETVEGFEFYHRTRPRRRGQPRRGPVPMVVEIVLGGGVPWS